MYLFHRAICLILGRETAGQQIKYLIRCPAVSRPNIRHLPGGKATSSSEPAIWLISCVFSSVEVTELQVVKFLLQSELITSLLGYLRWILR